MVECYIRKQNSTSITIQFLYLYKYYLYTTKYIVTTRQHSTKTVGQKSFVQQWSPRHCTRILTGNRIKIAKNVNIIQWCEFNAHNNGWHVCYEPFVCIHNIQNSSTLDFTFLYIKFHYQHCIWDKKTNKILTYFWWKEFHWNNNCKKYTAKWNLKLQLKNTMILTSSI